MLCHTIYNAVLCTLNHIFLVVLSSLIVVTPAKPVPLSVNQCLRSVAILLAHVLLASSLTLGLIIVATLTTVTLSPV